MFIFRTVEFIQAAVHVGAPPPKQSGASRHFFPRSGKQEMIGKEEAASRLHACIEHVVHLLLNTVSVSRLGLSFVCVGLSTFISALYLPLFLCAFSRMSTDQPTD